MRAPADRVAQAQRRLARAAIVDRVWRLSAAQIG